MWLLPSPARAMRACPLPGQGQGSETDGGDGIKKITNSENDSLLVERYLGHSSASGKGNTYGAACLRCTAIWDDEAKVWVAESNDVPGLVTEAPTLEALQAKIRVLVPELLELNHSDAGCSITDCVSSCSFLQA